MQLTNNYSLFRIMTHIYCCVIYSLQRRILKMFKLSDRWKNTCLLKPNTLSKSDNISRISLDCELLLIHCDFYWSGNSSLSFYRFIDSAQHLPASLDALVRNLKTKGIDKFKYTTTLADIYGVPLEKFLRKGVYPYSYVDGVHRFQEGLPPRQAFFNDLTDEELSIEDYNFVKNVWRDFSCNTLGDLHDV